MSNQDDLRQAVRETLEQALLREANAVLEDIISEYANQAVCSALEGRDLYTEIRRALELEVDELVRQAAETPHAAPGDETDDA